MYGGKTLFAQLMDFVAWTTFSKIVARYSGDHRVRRLSCGEQYRAMAFAPTDLPGESARYRDLPVGASVETLPHGLSRTSAAFDTGRCQRDARLAHSCRTRPAFDHPSPEVLRRR